MRMEPTSAQTEKKLKLKIILFYFFYVCTGGPHVCADATSARTDGSHVHADVSTHPCGRNITARGRGKNLSVCKIASAG
jgi:hypothetical protein